MKNLETYFDIRRTVDARVEELTTLHHNHLTCHKGCDKCCYSFRIFPVEWFAIANELGLEATPDATLPIADDERCAFLKNGACSIYASRPIICRTHGLPLLNMDEEGENYELSFCELNFTEADEDEFAEETVFVQDKYNAMLYNANKDFLAANPQLNLSPDLLIPLKALITR
jgi:Fe-S-cluster containining protein